MKAMLRAHRDTSSTWVMLLVGILGFLLTQRGGFGINLDIIATAADTMRTLAMLSVIVFGCFMLFREFKQPAIAAASCPVLPAATLIPSLEPAVETTVTLSASQFKSLVALANRNAIEMETAGSNASNPSTSNVSNASNASINGSQASNVSNVSNVSNETTSDPAAVQESVEENSKVD